MSDSSAVQSGRSTAREWARRIEAWDRSGLDAEAFVEREGGNYTIRTLKWWRSELRRRARSERPRTASSPPPSIPLVRVQVEREPTVSVVAAVIEVVVGDVVVRVPADADVSRAAELVSALAKAPR